MRRLIMVTVALVAVACVKPKEPERVTRKDFDELVAAMPDSAMRERWRAMQASGQMAPLESLRIPPQRMLTRPVTQIDTAKPAYPPPSIPPGAIAETRLYSAAALEAYSGPARLTSAAAGKVVLRLPERAEPVELYFKLPGTSQTLQIDSSLTLIEEQEFVAGSMRRTTIVTSPAGLVLLDLSDGSRREPYSRTFKDIPVRVVQGAAGDTSAPLVVTYAGQVLRVKPGTIARARDRSGEVQIFVLENFTTPQAALRGAEADPYHVRLFIWRSR